jgi:hypothetical protein
MKKRRDLIFVAVVTVVFVLSGCLHAGNGGENVSQTENIDVNETGTPDIDETMLAEGQMGSPLYGREDLAETVTLQIEGEEPVNVSVPLPREPTTDLEIRGLSPTSRPDRQPLLRFRTPEKNKSGVYDLSLSVEYVNGQSANSTIEDYLRYPSGQKLSQSEKKIFSLLQSSSLTSADKYYTNGYAEIAVSVFNVEPVNNADVESEITKPNNETEKVDLERVGEGIYRALYRLNRSHLPSMNIESMESIDQDELPTRYNATVTITTENETLRRNETWEASIFDTPIRINQTKIPSVEPGETAEIIFRATSVVGVREAEFGLSNFRKQNADDIIRNLNTSLNTSRNSIVVGQEKIQANVSVPKDAEPGNYTGALGTLVDDTDTSLVEPVHIEVEPS